MRNDHVLAMIPTHPPRRGGQNMERRQRFVVDCGEECADTAFPGVAQHCSCTCDPLLKKLTRHHRHAHHPSYHGVDG